MFKQQLKTDGNIPWNLLLDIGIVPDHHPDIDYKAQKLGFRYCHRLFLTFSTGEIADLYTPERFDYGLTVDETSVEEKELIKKEIIVEKLPLYEVYFDFRTRKALSIQ